MRNFHQFFHQFHYQGPDLDNEIDEKIDENSSNGPWVLIASAFGLGKRVPVTQFRLQKRAGMGLRAIKFRIKDDELVCLKVLGEGEELILLLHQGPSNIQVHHL